MATVNLIVDCDGGVVCIPKQSDWIDQKSRMNLESLTCGRVTHYQPRIGWPPVLLPDEWRPRRSRSDQHLFKPTYSWFAISEGRSDDRSRPEKQ
jgi:hypothetical protein